MPLQVASLDYDDGSGIAPNKLRSRAMVKPILKKLNSHTNSDRGSLDYDRSWDDQISPLGFPSLDYSYITSGQPAPYNSSTSGGSGSEPSRSRDVSFSFSSNEYPTVRSRNKYAHQRSPSGNSHASAATSSTNGRNGSFVHPFQQTPRTATPPLSYANSVASLDVGNVTREYASLDEERGTERRVYSSASTGKPMYATSSLGRSSLSEQRSASVSEGPQAMKHPLALRSSSTCVPRRTHSIHSAGRSRTDLQPGSTPSSNESHLSSTAPLSSASPIVSASTPPSSASPMSPLRTSLDLSGFRLRSRSELDAATQQEQVREARRKFEAKEKAKEEKYARQQLRKKERASNKDSRRHSRLRKDSAGGASVSSNGDIVPAVPRKSTSSNVVRRSGSREKMQFASHDYDAVVTDEEPTNAIEDVQFQTPKRRKTAKRATTGAWTAFMLWFRVRMLKVGRR